MNFNYWDLRQQPAGAIEQVTLQGNAANVRLFDSSSFSAFKAGPACHRLWRACHPFTGPAPGPPQRALVRRGRHGGYAGRGRAAVQVLPGRLPELRERALPSLNRLAESVAAMNHDQDELIPKDWDVFISHAHEDKDEIVRPLAHALQELGLSVWFDEFELRLGDSLRRKIDQGIARSAFGVVVLSNPFFAKNWAQYELDGLVTRSVGAEQVLLPLWHKITKAEVMAQSPSLADKVARSTTDSTLDEIAAEIAEIVHGAADAAA